MMMSDAADAEVFAELNVKLGAVEAAILAEADKREEEIVSAHQLADAALVSADASTRRAWRATMFGGIAGVVAVVALLFGWSAKATSDDLVAARKESQAGLCVALDDMRLRHNHFVQTAIDERQQLIDATNQSTATDEQKAKTASFFEGQIANYRGDLLTIIDCKNPDALASLFTKPAGG